MRLIDIGANLLDEMYQGRYNDKEYHPPDLDAVLKRSWDAGVDKIIITAGSLAEAKKALELARTDARLFCTVGCHPTRCGEFDAHPGGPEAYLEALAGVMREGQAEGKVVAVGECGLDYDRLQFCDKDVQRKYFEMQFKLAKESGLPMFLHLRAAASDFLEIIKQHSADYTAGVVHSFDGSLAEMEAVLSASPSLSIGINGCSLKTPDNLQVVEALPLGRMMVETDCPWCEIRSTHAGKAHVRAGSLLESKDKKKHDPGLGVKSRNEPCNLRQVVEVVAGVKGLKDVEEVAEALYLNTAGVFFPGQANAAQ